MSSQGGGHRAGTQPPPPGPVIYLQNLYKYLKMLKIIAGSHAAAGGGGAQQRGDGVGRVQRGAALLRPRGATPLHHLGQAQVSS